MYDYKLGLKCDHKIIDEEITLEGISPSYYTTMKYPIGCTTNLIEVREFNATDGLTNYSYTVHGLTNWDMTSSYQLTFNTDGISGVASMADGSTQAIPPKRYFVTYATIQSACPKCLGSGVMSDIGFDVIGQIKVVTGREKLKQQVRKILLTKLGNNEFYATYGSQLQELIGKKFNLHAQLMLQEYIRNALDELRSIQSTIADLPLSETFLRISKLTLQQDTNELRQVNVELEFMNAEYDSITTGVVYTV